MGGRTKFFGNITIQKKDLSEMVKDKIPSSQPQLGGDDPEGKIAIGNSDPINCIDVVPPIDAQPDSRLKLYIRPRGVCILDLWPDSSIHLIETYQIKGKTPEELVSKLRGSLAKTDVREEAQPRSEVYLLALKHTRNIEEQIKRYLSYLSEN